MSQNKMNSTLEKWTLDRPHYKFAADGVLDALSWSIQSPKIAIILKEPYGGWIPSQGDIRIRSYGSQFWWNIVRWKFAITEAFKNGCIQPEYPKSDDLPEIKNDGGILKTIAYINIKKNDENRKRSNDDDIMRYAISDAAYLREQIRDVQCDVLLCGGTFRYLCAVCENGLIRQIGKNAFIYSETLVIDFRHPGYWQVKGGPRALYAQLNSILEQDSVLNHIQSCGRGWGG